MIVVGSYRLGPLTCRERNRRRNVTGIRQETHCGNVVLLCDVDGALRHGEERLRVLALEMYLGETRFASFRTPRLRRSAASRASKRRPSGAAPRATRKRSAACGDTIERAQGAHGTKRGPPYPEFVVASDPTARASPTRDSSPDENERNEEENDECHASCPRFLTLALSSTGEYRERERARARLFPREEVADAAGRARERDRAPMRSRERLWRTRER